MAYIPKTIKFIRKIKTLTNKISSLKNIKIKTVRN